MPARDEGFAVHATLRARQRSPFPGNAKRRTDAPNAWPELQRSAFPTDPAAHHYLRPPGPGADSALPGTVSRETSLRNRENSCSVDRATTRRGAASPRRTSSSGTKSNLSRSHGAPSRYPHRREARPKKDVPWHTRFRPATSVALSPARAGIAWSILGGETALGRTCSTSRETPLLSLAHRSPDPYPHGTSRLHRLRRTERRQQSTRIVGTRGIVSRETSSRRRAGVALDATVQGRPE